MDKYFPPETKTETVAKPFFGSLLNRESGNRPQDTIGQRQPGFEIEDLQAAVDKQHRETGRAPDGSTLGLDMARMDRAIRRENEASRGTDEESPAAVERDERAEAKEAEGRPEAAAEQAQAAVVIAAQKGELPLNQQQKLTVAQPELGMKLGGYLEEKRSFGAKLKDKALGVLKNPATAAGFFAGAAFKGAVRSAVKRSFDLGAAGSGAVAGAVAGAAWEGGRAYLKERERIIRDIAPEQLEGLKGFAKFKKVLLLRRELESKVGFNDEGLKNQELLTKLKNGKVDKKAIAKAAMRGAFVGGVGGAAGGFLADSLGFGTTVVEAASVTKEQAASHAVGEVVKWAPPGDYQVQPGDTSIWSITKHYLESHGVANPSESQVLEAAKRVAEESKVGVAAWGIEGDVADTAIKPGFTLHLGALHDQIEAWGGTPDIRPGLPEMVPPGAAVPELNMAPDADGVLYNRLTTSLYVIGGGASALGVGTIALRRGRQRKAEQKKTEPIPEPDAIGEEWKPPAEAAEAVADVPEFLRGGFGERVAALGNMLRLLESQNPVDHDQLRLFNDLAANLRRDIEASQGNPDPRDTGVRAAVGFRPGSNHLVSLRALEKRAARLAGAGAAAAEEPVGEPEAIGEDWKAEQPAAKADAAADLEPEEPNWEELAKTPEATKDAENRERYKRLHRDMIEMIAIVAREQQRLEDLSGRYPAEIERGLTEHAGAMNRLAERLTGLEETVTGAGNQNFPLLRRRFTEEATLVWAGMGKIDQLAHSLKLEMAAAPSPVSPEAASERFAVRAERAKSFASAFARTARGDRQPTEAEVPSVVREGPAEVALERLNRADGAVQEARVVMGSESIPLEERVTRARRLLADALEAHGAIDNEALNALVSTNAAAAVQRRYLDRALPEAEARLAELEAEAEALRANEARDRADREAGERWEVLERELQGVEDKVDGIANLLARDERPEPVNYRARFQAAERAFEQFVLSGAQTDGFQKRFDRRLQQLRDSLDVQYRLVSAVFHGDLERAGQAEGPPLAEAVRYPKGALEPRPAFGGVSDRAEAEPLHDRPSLLTSKPVFPSSNLGRPGSRPYPLVPLEPQPSEFEPDRFAVNPSEAFPDKPAIPKLGFGVRTPGFEDARATENIRKLNENVREEEAVEEPVETPEQEWARLFDDGDKRGFSNPTGWATLMASEGGPLNSLAAGDHPFVTGNELAVVRKALGGVDLNSADREASGTRFEEAFRALVSARQRRNASGNKKGVDAINYAITEIKKLVSGSRKEIVNRALENVESAVTTR